MKCERVYLADETGWGVQSKHKQVIGRNEAKHVYLRKTNDESHKTLMLGICGNGDVIKPLIILEKSFPLIGGVSQTIFLSKFYFLKPKKGLWKKMFLCNG